MEKFYELIEKLNALKIIQKSMDWSENIPSEIWDEYFSKNHADVKYGLDVDTHRWYETSITVISIYGKLLGIRHISNLFSESSMCEDCFVTIHFFEMKEVQVTSYEILNK